MDQASIAGGIPLVCNSTGNNIKTVSKAYHEPFISAIFGYVMRYYDCMALLPLDGT